MFTNGKCAILLTGLKLIECTTGCFITEKVVALIALKLVLKLNTSLRNYEDLSESIEQILNELILNLDHSKRVIKKHLKQFKKL